MRRLFSTLLAGLVFLASGLVLRAQQTQKQPPSDAERGVALYRTGDIRGAIAALSRAVNERKQDAESWYYLGLALESDGQVTEAQKAFETAARLQPGDAASLTALARTLLVTNDPTEAARKAQRALKRDSQNAEAFYITGAASLSTGDYSRALAQAEAALKLNADFAPASLLKSEALLNLYAQALPLAEKRRQTSGENPGTEGRRYLQDAARSLERFMALDSNAGHAAIWRQQLRELRFYAGATAPQEKESARLPAYLPTEVKTKARIGNKPEPEYTEAARRAGASGTVVMLAILASDGKVRHILVLGSLGYGLTEAALEAAQKMEFTPATKDGQPVSVLAAVAEAFRLK